MSSTAQVRKPSLQSPTLLSPAAKVRSSSPGKGVRSTSPGSKSPMSTSFASPNSPGTSNLQTVQSASACFVPPSAECFSSFRNFVRVRPFKEKEGKTKPPDQVVPRPALELVGNTLTILDPAKGFKSAYKVPPGKVNPYDSANILWSFVDPLETEIERKANRNVPQLQADVYRKVVEPVFPSILEGYSAAFICLGAADTGKATTMFGDEAWSEGNKGIFPRFVEDLYEKYNEKIRGETTLKFEASCVEVTGVARAEKFVDLLAKKPYDLKVVDTDTEGVILEGSVRAKCPKPADMVEQVYKAVKPVRGRKNSSYAVTVHITETTTYKNIDNPNAPPKILSRRSAVSFSILRAVHSNATFARCVDNCVERDSGANALSKPPTRDSCWTRLFADVFMQKLNVTTISCVSPFFEHVKDNVNTLEYAKKLGDIKTAPCLRTDEAEVEYRRLADEIFNLDEAVDQANTTIQIIQDEIDRCHREYEEAAADNTEAFADCQRSKDATKAFQKFQLREKAKGSVAVAKEAAAVERLQVEIDGIKEETKVNNETADTTRQDRQAAEERISKIETDISKQKQTNSVFVAELETFTREEDAVREKEKYLETVSEGASDEAKVALVQQAIALKSEAPELKANAAKAEADFAEQKKKEDAFAKDVAAQRAKKQSLDAKKAELARVRAEVAKMNKEIADMEADCDARQKKIENAPKGCCVIQ